MKTTEVMKRMVIFLILLPYRTAEGAPTVKPRVSPAEETLQLPTPSTGPAVQPVGHEWPSTSSESAAQPDMEWDRWPTSLSALKAVRLRHNCSPPWNRYCQTSDSIIFKRSLEKPDLLRATDGQTPDRQSTGPAQGQMFLLKIPPFLRLHRDF
ncbi:uncharacterized protein LOC144905692 [Branchiostoma floridae x Branchiostoma belcheri]